MAIAVAVAALAVVATVIVWRAGPAEAKPFATLDVTAGSAELQRAGGEAFRPASDGAGLRPGDTIRTPPDGRVTIEYFDGSLTRLDYGTTFTLRELVGESDDGTVVDALQTSGATFSRVVELTGSQSRFDVETPTAVASVRGTTFFTEILEDGGARFGVIDGEVLVSGEGGAVRLIPGRGVDVDASGTVGSTFILIAEMLGSDWLYYNLCVLDRLPGACREVEPKEEHRKRQRPEPKPQPPPSSEPTGGSTAPAVEDQVEKKDPAPDPPADENPPQPPPPDPPTQEPPSPPPPEPPPPEPSEHPGSPPCDNPGNGTPCDGSGNAGSPPGHDRPGA
jgi:hypothetical protein